MSRRFLFGCLIAVALPFCAIAAEKSARRENQTADPERASSADYVLAPQDVIRMQIYQEPDLNRELKISAEGVVELPLIKRVELKGKTVREAEQLIRNLYDADYLVDPQVNLTVLEYAPRTVEVFGAVSNPGVISFPKEEILTLTKAISLAGSFNRLANKKAVTLKRRMPDGTFKTFPINVDELTKGASEAENWPLQPGDVITVPEKIL